MSIQSHAILTNLVSIPLRQASNLNHQSNQYRNVYRFVSIPLRQASNVGLCTIGVIEYHRFNPSQVGFKQIENLLKTYSDIVFQSLLGRLQTCLLEDRESTRHRFNPSQVGFKLSDCPKIVSPGKVSIPLRQASNEKGNAKGEEPPFVSIPLRQASNT